MNSSSTEEKFHSAVELIKSLPKNGSIYPSNETKLKFYSYYKQATEGPCEVPKPGFWDIVNRAKWDAWNKLGNMSKEDAMKNYVEEFVHTVRQHSLEDLDDPAMVNDFLYLMGPFMDMVPKQIQDTFVVMNGKGKKPLNNNSEDHSENDFNKEFADSSSAHYSAPLNGHNLNGNTESDNDEFSDTLERVNEDEPAEVAISSGKPVKGNNPGVAAKGPNIITVRGGGEHRFKGGDNNSSGGPSGSRDNRLSGQLRSYDYPLHPPSNNNLIEGAGGSRRGGGEGLAELSPDVGEQLAMAVIRLQHIMEQVVVRLESLETLITQRTADSASLQISARNKSRWSIFGISPKLAFIILAWPFIAQWLMYVIRKRQRHLQ